MTGRAFVLLAALLLLASGCSTMKKIVGVRYSEPSTLNTAESRWLLIKNPRYGDVPSEPEYVWVEEDKVPITFTTLIRGKRAIIASPEIVAKYGPPPGGGKISPRQGVPTPTAAEPVKPKPAVRTTAGTTAAPRPVAVRTAVAPAEPEPKRGYVVYVDTTRIVIDLTASDGVHRGTTVSLRRDKIPIVHPVTGEVLGELDEEVGTARITETREKFSVAEIQSVVAGAKIQIQDRVVPQ
jgi:hypothetical protein